MNFVGLVMILTAFMVLMLQVSHQVDFDKEYPTSGRIYRVDKVGADDDDIFRNIVPRGYADDIINSSALHLRWRHDAEVYEPAEDFKKINRSLRCGGIIATRKVFDGIDP